MTIDVTVVVPVYNPGPFIEACIDGLLIQSLPPERLEIIFVDDGSTDETPQRLDQLAAEHPHIHVIHQENSGWSGKPRNVGIESARGDYIFFSDHDDALGPEALERMVAMARRTNADVLVPKMVSHGRPVPTGIFRFSIDKAVLGQDLLMQSLSPHKLFRRGFLNTHELRYPEGKVRLEDEVFVMAAFLLADVVSVLSDYPCYYRIGRHDAGNAALQQWEAAFYFRFVGEVIDVIEAHTTPGPLREALLQRPYEAKMLAKLTAKRMTHWEPALRRDIFDEVRRLATDRFPVGFEDRLLLTKRAHARALLANRLDRMEDVAARCASVKPLVGLTALGWSGDAWEASFDVEFVHPDGSPILITEIPGGWSIDPRLIPQDLASEPYTYQDVTFGRVDLVLRDREDNVEWYTNTQVRSELVAVDGDPSGARRLVLRCTSLIDPAKVGGGRPLLPGSWDARLRVLVIGLDRYPVVPGTLSDGSPLPVPALVGPPQVVVAPQHPRRPQRLSFRVRAARGKRTAMTRVMERAGTAEFNAGRVVVPVDLSIGSTALPKPPSVVLIDADGAVIARYQARVAATARGSVLTCRLRGGRKLPKGRLRIGVKVGRHQAVVVGRIRVARFGRLADFRPRTRTITVHPSGHAPNPPYT